MTTTSTAPQTAPQGELAPAVPTPPSGRVQLALNVDDLAQAVAFYTKLLGTPPAKLRPGYANFSVAAPPLKLVLLENPGSGGSLNHLGIEVASSEQVQAAVARLEQEGLLTAEERGATCCFATQDKAWVTGPDGERWETYTVLADSETFGSSPKTGGTTAGTAACCGDANGHANGDANGDAGAGPSTGCC